MSASPLAFFFFIRCEATDLQLTRFARAIARRSWSRRALLAMPVDASDRAIRRAIRRALDLGPDMRPDGWSGADWSWRCGAVGATGDRVDADEVTEDERANAVDPFGMLATEVEA